MADRYVEWAKANMGVLEQLFKGLPGVRSYVDKELRRDADRRLRNLIATGLESQKRDLFDLQKKLLQNGGLRWLDDVDALIQRLQILIDRIKTVGSGYTGLFDAVKIKQEQLNALHRFDAALATRVAAVDGIVQGLAVAVASKEGIENLLNQLGEQIAELFALLDKRQEAIVSPDLLMETGYAPEADEVLIKDEGLIKTDNQ